MSQDFVDLIRFAHLFCFALGMGAGIYFDVRALRRINTPFARTDIAEFEQVHKFVFAALAGLWITGLMMVYVRTGFQLEAFTPKLWVKLMVVVGLTANAFLIGHVVLPRVAQSVGRKAIDMPLKMILPMTLTTAASAFFWMSGLILGISVTLKTATWATLGAVLAAEFVVVVLGAVTMVLVLRGVIRRRNEMERSGSDMRGGATA